LVVLLMDYARGSRLLQLMWRGTLLGVVGMVLHQEQSSVILLNRDAKCDGKNTKTIGKSKSRRDDCLDTRDLRNGLANP
jgi:hypothetical protein